MPDKPSIAIEYCTQCRFVLRAGWLAQELLFTFADDLAEVALRPSSGGRFRVLLDERRCSTAPTMVAFPTPRSSSSGFATSLHPAAIWAIPIVKRRLKETLSYSHHQDGVGFPASPGGVSAVWSFQMSERPRRLAGKPARSVRIAPDNRPCGVSRRVHAPPPAGPPSAVSIRSRRMGTRRSFGMTKLHFSRLAWPVVRRQLGGVNNSVVP